MSKPRKKSEAAPNTLPASGAPAAPRRRSARHGRQEDLRIRRLAVATARLMSDRHCENLLVLDVRGLSSVADYLILGSGTSDRQIRAVADEVEQAARQSGFSPYGREIDGPATWVVLDFVDVVVHLFDPATRAHYDLEMLWGDAPRVTWRRRRAPAT
jgi:ribosome-associated protein